MYMTREVFHCKPGKAKEIVSRFKKLAPMMAAQGMGSPRIYTDLSGENYWTVVVEMDVNSLDDLANGARSAPPDPETAAIMSDYHEFVLGGKREIYKLE